MKLLLTAAGVKNHSIANAIDSLTGLERNSVKIGFIPTSANGESGNKDWFFAQILDLYKFNFKWIDFVDFSASGFDWRERLFECNVIYVSGGNTFHLLNEVRKHKFDDWLKDNLDKVYIGASAGSILMSPTITTSLIEPADTNNVGITDFSGLGHVDFEISPHTPEEVTYESNMKYARKTKNKLYAIDNNTAILVNDKKVEVVSEGEWKLY